MFNQVTGTVDGIQPTAMFLTLLIPVIAARARRSVAVKVPPVLRLPPVVVYCIAVALVGVAFSHRPAERLWQSLAVEHS